MGKQRAGGLGRRVTRVAGAVLLALIAWAVMVSGGGLPGLTSFAAQIASACGLGTGPTMLANGQPALLHPQAVGTTGGANQPLGQFSQVYAVNTPINFAEDLSRAPNAPSNLSIIWNFGDGSPTVTNNTPTHTFTKPGTYSVETELAGSDNGAGNGSIDWTNFENAFDSASITVVAQTYSNPPVAVAHASTSIINQGGSVTFDATGSHSQDGSPVKYLWNFNDGQTSTQAQVSHEFGVISNGLVSLTVTDGRGAITVMTLTIVISSAPLASNVTSIAAGGAVSFDAAANLGTPGAAASAGAPSAASSGTPGASATGAGATGGLTPSYAWSFGDGTPSISTTTATTSHTFAKPGQYTVAVQEIAGQSVNAVEAVLVTVTPAAPAPKSSGLQFKTWEILAAIGIVLLSILLTGLSAVRAEKRRARAIIAAKAQKAAMRQRARGAAARGRGYEEDYGERGSGSRRAPRRGEYDDYDDRASSQGRGDRSGRRASSRRDDYDGDGGYDDREDYGSRSDRSGSRRGGYDRAPAGRAAQRGRADRDERRR